MEHPGLAKLIHEFSGGAVKQGDVGVELEIEGDHLPSEVTGWVVKEEGSLRGRNGRVVPMGEPAEDRPFEYVTHRPVTLRLLDTRLAALHTALTANNTRVRLSERASTHIHVNMGGQTVKSLLGFLLVWICVEPVILRACGPTRNGNLFCLPSYETADLPHFIYRVGDAVLYGQRWPNNRGKYAALNTDPLMSLGSVEARCFPNTIQPADIAKWARWMVNIRDAGAMLDPTRVIDVIYNNPNYIIQNIFGDENVYAPCYPHSPQELVMYGAEQAYEVCKSAMRMLDFKEKEKKEKKDTGITFHEGEHPWNVRAITDNIFDEEELR